MNTTIRFMRRDLRKQFEDTVGMAVEEFFPSYEYTHKLSGRKVKNNVFPFHNYAFQEGLIHAENVGGDIEKVLNTRALIGAFPGNMRASNPAPVESSPSMTAARPSRSLPRNGDPQAADIGQMKLEQSFVGSSVPRSSLEGISGHSGHGRMPSGASLLEDQGNGVYRGRIQSKLGPFSASFEGEASISSDAGNKTGHVEGKGHRQAGRQPQQARPRLSAGTGRNRHARHHPLPILRSAVPIAQFGRTVS
jgi:hypothetical protein